MGQLDGGRGRHEPDVLRVAELSGEQHEHRTEALAARIDQMQGSLGEQGFLGTRRFPDDGLNEGKTLADVGFDSVIGKVDRYGTGHAGSKFTAHRHQDL